MTHSHLARTIGHRAAMAALGLVGLTLSSAAVGAEAFPGAVGFGTETRGAYSLYEATGEPADLPVIVRVTNLDDSGTGSYRAALEATGPRIAIFDTGGVVQLQSTVRVRDPYLTVAGQTAPGDGICLRGAPTMILTHDVIIRGLRSRPGDGAAGEHAEERDAFNVGQADPWPFNIVVDHCSFSWAIDETVNITGPSHHVTFSYNIISEALDRSIHPGPEEGHSKGFHMMPGPENYTLHHNLQASNLGRNFLVGGGCVTREWNAPTEIELVNNVVHNPVGGLLKPNRNGCCTLPGGDNRPQMLHYLANYVQKGPNTNVNHGLELDQTGQILPTSQLFLAGNLSASRPTDSGEEWSFVSSGVVATNKADAPVFVSSGIVPVSVDDAVADIVASVGAIPRDTTDQRMVAEFVEGQGQIKNCVEQDAGNPNCDEEGEYVPGGYPTYPEGTPPVDTDDDGMSDEWELARGLDPSDASDAHGDRDDDGYFNVEEYINCFFDAAGCGAGGAGGSTSAGGAGGEAAQGDGGAGAFGPSAGAGSDEEGGCGCRMAPSPSPSALWLVIFVGAALLRRARRARAVASTERGASVKMCWRGFAALSSLLLPGTALAAGAFPGAEGFGTDTRGAYGLYEQSGDPTDLPEILRVTHLGDAGDGSFRAAATAPGPRIIVFDTGGVIPVQSELTIRSPYLTVAGQTAPGDGIVLSGERTWILTHDVVVRGMRFRGTEAHDWVAPLDATNLIVTYANGSDYAHHVVVDRCSLSWSRDKLTTVSGNEVHDITFSYNIYAEPLWRAGHPEVEHGLFFLGQPGPERLTLHHNLFHSGQGRAPCVCGTGNSTQDSLTRVEWYNNVASNTGTGVFKVAATGAKPDDQGQLVHAVRNYIQPGPSWPSLGHGFEVADAHQDDDTRIYLSGNIGPGRPDDSHDEWAIVSGGPAYVRAVDLAFSGSGIVAEDLDEAIGHIVQSAGAVPRDSVDQRVIAEFVDGNLGSWKNCVEHDGNNPECDAAGEHVPGGFPAYATGLAAADEDGDGMGDDWEELHGLDPSVPDCHGHDLDEDYTNIEVYLHGLFGDAAGGAGAGGGGSGGTGGSAEVGGAGGSGDSPIAASAGGDDDGGCGCRMAPNPNPVWLGLLVLCGGAWLSVRRRAAGAHLGRSLS